MTDIAPKNKVGSTSLYNWMLLVRTYLAPSSIHGIGVFVTEAIAKGTVVWRFKPGFDAAFTDEDLGMLPEVVAADLDQYIYQLAGFPYWILDGDNGRHTNHSRTPNTGSRASSFAYIALCDMSPGEELTCDYRVFRREEVQSWF